MHFLKQCASLLTHKILETAQDLEILWDSDFGLGLVNYTTKGSTYNLIKPINFKGSPKRNEDAGIEPLGSRAAGHSQHDFQERLHLLPGLLPAVPGVLQTGAGGGGGIQKEYVQSR